MNKLLTLGVLVGALWSGFATAQDNTEEDPFLERYRLDSHLVLGEGHDECMEMGYPKNDRCFYLLHMESRDAIIERLTAFCGDTPYRMNMMRTIPPVFHVFCTEDESIAGNVEGLHNNLRGILPYQEQFQRIESNYGFPEGTLIAITAPIGYERPSSDKMIDIAHSLGLSIDSEVGEGHPAQCPQEDAVLLSAESIARELSTHYSQTGDLNESLTTLFGERAPNQARIKTVYKTLHGVCI